MQRISWNDYFMKIAEIVATRSTCNKLSVGCVITKDRRIIATGYCGAPGGMVHCTEVGCKEINGHCIRALHAEVNAILQCVEHGISTKNSTIYLTHSPCWHCALMLINAKIMRIYYKKEYLDNRGNVLNLLRSAGILIEEIKE